MSSKVFGKSTNVFGMSTNVFGMSSNIFGMSSNIFGMSSNVFRISMNVFGIELESRMARFVLPVYLIIGIRNLNISPLIDNFCQSIISFGL